MDQHWQDGISGDGCKVPHVPSKSPLHRGRTGKMVPIWDCLTNMNQCNLDADNVNAPLGYINRNIITRTGEMIKSLSASLIKSQRVLCLDLDAVFKE